MSFDYSSVHNHLERQVFDAVTAMAEGYPGLHGDGELLADVACVALNRLPPRYIRNPVDFAFYLTDVERARMDRKVRLAVAQAFEFVQARVALGARA